MEILDEISDLVKNGYKEIILLGQNVNSYKSQISSISCHSAFDAESIITHNSPTHNNPNNKPNPANWIPASAGMTQSVNFPILLKLINAIPGDFWIRFLTSHPKDMTEELIKTVSECEKCAEYIHLALQSGDDEILKKMNRKYTAEYYLKLIKKIRASFASIRSGFGRYPAISTDIIVGFPGETEKQFLHTAKVMKEAKFDMAYLNKYSPRAGTASAKLDDDVSWEEKKRRENILNEILRKTALENNQKYIGEVVETLVEKINNNLIYGKTRSFKNVKITAGSIVPSGLWSQNAKRDKSQSMNAKRLHSLEARTMEPANLIGQFVKIKITRAGAWGLEGEIAE